MADAPKIILTGPDKDTLKSGSEKINKAIDNANEALSTANTSKNTADSAKSKADSADIKADTALANSESTQTQLNAVVIDGDSSPQIAQALADTPYTNLREKHNAIDAQLAESAKKLEKIFNVEVLMQENAFTTLQQVFDFIPANTELHFTKMYEVSTELLLSKPGIKLVSDVPSTTEGGAGIKNIGTGNCLRVTGAKLQMDGMTIKGNGDPYNFGTGATGQHGIVFDGSTTWFLNNCQIHGHGGHGVFTQNGVWNGRFNQSYIWGNKLDGINSLSTGTSATQQNGNNLVLIATQIGVNGGNGIHWLASQLSIHNSDITGNNGAGILFDFRQSLAVCGSVDIRGNYIENNKNGQINVISTSTYGIKSLIVEGNLFNASYTDATKPKSLIVFSGQTFKNDYVEIGNNFYTSFGGYIDKYVDGGNTLTSTCKVYQTANTGAFINLGLAKLELTTQKTRGVYGLTNQKSLAWSTPQKSDNAYASGIDTYFALPLTEGEVLQNLSFYIESDTASSYNVSLYLYEKDLTAAGTWASVGSYLPTYSSGGNNLVNWNVSASSVFRAKAGKAYFLRIIMTKPATGTTLYLNNINMTII